MTLTIELPDEQAIALKTKAQAQGLSTEQYAQQLLRRDLTDQGSVPSAAPRRPISQIIAEIMADTPPEELAKLPKDGASEHDHYLYGWPKSSR